MQPRVALSVLGSMLLAFSAVAADSVLGTLTVKGKPTPLKHVVAAVQADPDDPDAHWLVVLVSDVAVAEADRTPARLLELSTAGKLKAVRVLWKEGVDRVVAAPYHQALPQSGHLGSAHPSINLDRYDAERFEGFVKSKMLGQDWFFEAHIKAALAHAGVAEIEPALVEEEEASGSAAPKRRAKA